jgi:hypothetical protein
MQAPILKCTQDPNLYILNQRAANTDTRNQTWKLHILWTQPYW